MQHFNIIYYVLQHQITVKRKHMHTPQNKTPHSLFRSFSILGQSFFPFGAHLLDVSNTRVAVRSLWD